MRRTYLILAVVLSIGTSVGRAQTSYPMLMRIEPTAVQRGTTAEITISGTGSFAGAFKLLCEQPGLSGEVAGETAAVTSTRRRRMITGGAKAKLTVAADAPLGPREVRVAAAKGVSSVGQVVVVNDPVIAETDDRANDRPERAQAITLPVVLSGTIGKQEDVDWYAFPAAAGQRITFSVWANRLENKIHDLQAHFDPIVAIHDAQGRELAVDDNHDFADPRLTYEFKQSGTYLIQIRDTTYSGNAFWTYVLQISAGPAVASVLPMAVNPGETAALHARGVNFDPEPAISLKVPADIPPGPQFFALNTAQGPTLAVPLVVTPLPLATEAGDAQSATVRTQRIDLPIAVSGRLAEPGDVDSFRFEAKKGQAYVFEVIARRAGAAIDPVLRVIDRKESRLAEADDVFGKDPRLDWTAPADGLYALHVSDLHNRGGDEYGYVLTARAAAPEFTLTCDPDKINVGPGGRVPMFIQLTRRTGFSGPVTLEWQGLPPGVSASPLTIPASMTQGVSVVSAAADCKPSAGFLKLTGRGEGADDPIVRNVEPKQEIYIPGGGRGFWPVNTIALGVTDPSDITVEAKPEQIRLTPGATAAIDVTVTRHGGYDQAVNLAVLFQHLGSVFANPLPPGVIVREAGSKTLLGPKETAGKIILEARPNASSCDNFPICVMGHVSINFVVKTSYASAPLYVTVAPKGSAVAK